MRLRSREAYKDGRLHRAVVPHPRVNDNPYEMGTDAHAEWHRGYIDEERTMNADLNKLYDLTSPRQMSTARDQEERRRIDLRRYLQRALSYVEEMDKEQAEWPRLIAECNALCDLMEAGLIADAIYRAHVLPRAQAAAPPPPRRVRHSWDVDAYEDRLDREGYSC